MASIRSGIGENMENRYLFKAKRVDNGEWAVGYYGVIGERSVIIEKYAENYYCPDTCGSRHGNQIHEVNSKTICQCTGLKDKNGKLIWENDIVRDKEGNCYKAFWQNNYYQFSWICVKSDIFQIGTKWDLYIWRSYEIEVIGNTFDNPELLESEEK